jgi:glycosyltransferase involved in cell wall biosynthesis
MENKNYFFFITCLEAGGAQRALIQLIEHIRSIESSSKIYVVNLSKGGEELETIILNNTDKLFNLDLKNFSFKKIINVFKFIKLNRNYSILVGWMYHAGLLAWLLSIFSSKMKLIFSIHHSGVDSKNLSIRTLFIVYLLGLISYSKRVKNIVFCAESSFAAHLKAGYPKNKSKVIFNGVDTSKISLKDDPTEKNIFKIVMAARFDPIKNHENLFIALTNLNKKLPFSLSLYGENIDVNNRILIDLINKYELAEILKIEGVDPQLREKFNNYDLLVLPSNSEAFPLVIPEAMLCGVPCIASSVGDIPNIIGNYGWLVPPKDPNELSQALENAYKLWIYDEGWKELRNNCRKRIEENFSSNRFCERYYDCMSSM